MKLLLATILLASTFSAYAALPPQWDQVAKFKTVLNHAKLIEGEQAGLVKAITEVETNVFAVEFDKYHCTYRVTIAPIPKNYPGPVDYEVKNIEQPTCERP